MPLVLRIAVRDAPKRLVFSAVLLAMLAHYGGKATLLPAVVLILFYELTAFALYHRLPASGQSVSPLRAAVVIFLFGSSTFAYNLPAILLIQQPSQTAQFAGLLWISASAIHIAGAHGAIVLLAWGTAIPSAVCIAIALATAHPGPLTPPSYFDYGVLAGFCLCWVGNLFEVIHAQAANRRAFGEARFNAEVRLKQLDFLARHDALTGLFNRAAFDEALSDVLLVASKDGEAAVFLLDLDGFKPVNDKHGHAAGDHVLATVARRLIHALPQGHVARLGGDEFVVLLPGGSPQEMQDIRQALATTIARPIQFEDISLSVSVSIGYALSRKRDTVKSLTARADQDMYATKSRRARRRSTA